MSRINSIHNRITICAFLFALAINADAKFEKSQKAIAVHDAFSSLERVGSDELAVSNVVPAGNPDQIEAKANQVAASTQKKLNSELKLKILDKIKVLYSENSEFVNAIGVYSSEIK